MARRTKSVVKKRSRMHRDYVKSHQKRRTRAKSRGHHPASAKRRKRAARRKKK